MSTKTISALKIRQILQITKHVNDVSRGIATASSAATQVILSTKSDALNYLAGDLVKISDGDASENNTVGTDGDSNTGVVAGLTALQNTYDNTPVIQLLERELLSDTEIKALIDDAVLQYSRDVPLLKKFEVQGNSESEFDLPSDWSTGFSYVENIEYPAGDSIPNFVDKNEFKIEERIDSTDRVLATATSGQSQVTMNTVGQAVFFKSGEIVYIGDDDANEVNWIASDGNRTTGVVAVKNALANEYDASPVMRKLNHLKFLVSTPLASEYFTYYYRIPHTFDDTSANDTVQAIDLQAVNHLAAAFCALAISAEFAKKQKSSIGADSVDFGIKSDQWQKVADANKKIYADHIGKGESGKSAAGIIVDLDSRFSWDRKWLFHGGRAR